MGYTAETTNTTNMITATAASGTEITITVNGAPHTNGTAATWADGENSVIITVSNGTVNGTYTVTVLKSN